MKKLLFLTAVGVILAAPASAVQKCIALNENAGLTSNFNYRANRTDWFQELDNGIMVRGVSMCAHNTGEPRDVLLNDEGLGLAVRSATDETININCWCKMTTPVESRWVYAYALDTYRKCVADCSGWCQMFFANDSGFRSVMFNNLID